MPPCERDEYRVVHRGIHLERGRQHVAALGLDHLRLVVQSAAR